jgi:hypothetical protein
MNIEEFITNRDDWKLKLQINECLSPEKLKHIRFSGEQYDKDGNLMNSSFYDFYLTENEIIRLANLLLK